MHTANLVISEGKSELRVIADFIKEASIAMFLFLCTYTSYTLSSCNIYILRCMAQRAPTGMAQRAPTACFSLSIRVQQNLSIRDKFRLCDFETKYDVIT